MIDWDRLKSWIKIGLAVIMVGTFFGGLAMAARLHFGNLGVTIVDIAMTGVLTGALAYLYFQQTRILDEQQDLFTHQLNREARQLHTETLRERVRMWHGNPERKSLENQQQGPIENLPQVRGASFRSASNLGIDLQLGWENEFHTIPVELRNDPYFEDLLENHASNLRETKAEIEELHGEFTTLRGDFIEQYEDGIVEDRGDYRIEPASNLSNWIFELIVLYERNRLYGDSILDRALSNINQNKQSPLVPDKSELRFHADFGRGSAAIYSAKFEEADRDELREWQEEIEAEILDVVKNIIHRIDEDEPYSIAREAASILDRAQVKVEKLDELLIEYYGRPIYSGDCKYLQEARI